MPILRSIPTCFALLVACAPLTGKAAELAATTGWRGNGAGRFASVNPPTKWSRDSSNIVWKVELAQGYSSPVLCVDDDGAEANLFVAVEPSDLLCIDADDGRVHWRVSTDYSLALGEAKAREIADTYARFDAEKKALARKYDPIRKANPDAPEVEVYKARRKEINEREREYQKRYPKEKRGGAGNAAATVVCDGRRVFVVFGTGIVAAFDVDGKRLWARYLEAPPHNFGHSTSPVIAAGHLIIHIDKLFALDPSSGEMMWQSEVRAHHGTPAVAHVGKTEVLIMPVGTIVDAETGKVLAEKLFNLSRNSPLVEGDVLYVQGSGRANAFRLPSATGDPLALELLWESTVQRDQRMASSLLYDGLLYGAGRRGIIDVLDAKTGQIVYKQRLDIGELFSSPTMAGGLIYFGGRDGRTLVLRPGRKFEKVAINESDRVTTNPVFLGDRMYLRTDKHLLCIRK